MGLGNKNALLIPAANSKGSRSAGRDRRKALTRWDGIVKGERKVMFVYLTTETRRNQGLPLTSLPDLPVLGDLRSSVSQGLTVGNDS